MPPFGLALWQNLESWNFSVVQYSYLYTVFQMVDASHVYLLMGKEHRISRNARASWYFNHLNTNIPESKLQHGSETDHVSVWLVTKLVKQRHLVHVFYKHIISSPYHRGGPLRFLGGGKIENGLFFSTGITLANIFSWRRPLEIYFFQEKGSDFFFNFLRHPPPPSLRSLMVVPLCSFYRFVMRTHYAYFTLKWRMDMNIAWKVKMKNQNREMRIRNSCTGFYPQQKSHSLLTSTSLCLFWISVHRLLLW